MAASVKSGFSTNSSAYTSTCGPKPKDALVKVWKFCRRLFYVRQMDFKYAIWQILRLMINPQKLYQNFQYRKMTKGQFARDDPAFLVLLAGTFILSTLIFGIMVSLPVLDMLYVMLWMVCIDCIGFGMLTATVFWYFGNKFLLNHPRTKGNELEWGFCFDVHLNSFYPFLVVVHLLQLPFLPFIVGKTSFVPVLFGNAFWLLAFGYYWYITFLGYNIQPQLQKSHIYLAPLVVVAIFYLISILIGWNWTNGMVMFYEHRIGHIRTPT